MRISEFIEKANEAAAPDEVVKLFERAIAEFGYDRFALAPVTGPAQDALERTGSGPALFVNCPGDWYEHYRRNGYYEIDAVALAVPARRFAFRWEDLLTQEPLSAKQQLILHESREAGLHNGLSIPIHGPRGECYVVSLATGSPRRDDRPPLNTLQILAIQFQLAFVQAGHGDQEPAPATHLTERERECLTWTARGKSAWAISRILGISEHTINFHLKSAMRKLGTANRVAAVAQAIRFGLILP